MKRIVLSTLLSICCTVVFSQQKTSISYTIKGALVDSLGQTVIGASVQLSTAKDTILTSTGVDGRYVFSGIKSQNFSIDISSLGFSPFHQSYSYSTDATLINLPLISLKIQTNMLDQIIVDGTPAITFKTDTMEYKASDYKVRENASVEDLVKKMDGMEVDKDGALKVQGEAVVRARINGKDYFGGDVAKAIKDLPADVVDKIQIVDDYGDEAAKTGIKDGDPEKVINIVTRRDKKVGNKGKFESGLGSNDRYKINVGGNRFNGNQQMGIKLGLNNTITGVAGGGGDSGGSGGTKKSSEAGVYFNDDLTAKLSFNGSYNYNGGDINSLNNSNIEEYNAIGTIYSVRNGVYDDKNVNHNFNAKLEYDPDDASWVTFRPELRYQSANNFSNNAVIQTGAIRQDQKSINSSKTSTPSYNLRLNAGHRFNKKGTTLSFEINASNDDNEQYRDAANNILYYDSTSNILLKDSLLHRQINIDNISENYRSSITFSQPVSEKARLEFNGQMNYRGYDNQQITNVLNNAGDFNEVDSLSRIFNYSFTETRLALNYRFRDKKYNYALGVTAVPGLLKGRSESSGNVTRRSSFNLIPIFRFEYQWSKQKRLSIRYYGRPQEPSYNQIQDVPDVTNPQNPVVGNPNLKAAFRHYVRADYNNYIINSKISIHAKLDATLTQNQVIRNNIFIKDNYNSLKRETHFVNADGNYSYSGDYHFSKHFAENAYAISLDGNVDFNRSVSMTRNEENIGKTWSFRQRLGLDINPKEWLELTPNLRYNTSMTDFSLASSTDNKNSNLAVSVEGKTYFIKTLFMGYDLSKNFVSGINANVTSNPFIINASLTKEFFARKNGSISLRAYDLLNQNNFVTRRVTDNAIIDTRSNALSQYFMVSLNWAPQKWTSGGSSRDRKGDRNGDGSYRR